jgi:hypothetical protein
MGRLGHSRFKSTRRSTLIGRSPLASRVGQAGPTSISIYWTTSRITAREAYAHTICGRCSRSDYVHVCVLPAAEGACVGAAACSSSSILCESSSAGQSSYKVPEEADACFAELVGEFAPVLAKIKVEPACVCACTCACMACGVLAVHMGACASMHMCAWLCGWMDGWSISCRAHVGSSASLFCACALLRACACASCSAESQIQARARSCMHTHVRSCDSSKRHGALHATVPYTRARCMQCYLHASCCILHTRPAILGPGAVAPHLLHRICVLQLASQLQAAPVGG